MFIDSYVENCLTTNPILDAVSRMTDRVEQAESIAADSELNRILGPGLLDRRLEELANDREVAGRLEELKRKHDAGDTR